MDIVSYCFVFVKVIQGIILDLRWLLNEKGDLDMCRLFQGQGAGAQSKLGVICKPPKNLVWPVTGVGKAERWTVEIWGAGEWADKTEASILIS